MIKLLIDTASSRIILGLFQDEKILSEINEENDNQISVRIFPLIDKLFGLSEIKPEMVDEIIVVNGPGSFTGVRIGVTIAKTYAWALHKKITIISELQMMASTKTSAKYRIAMIDARRNAVYAGIYDENLNSVLPDQYITLNQLQSEVKKLDGSYAYVSYQKFPDIDVICPDVNLTMIIEKHQEDEGLNPHEVKPNYLKKTEAEEKLGKSC